MKSLKTRTLALAATLAVLLLVCVGGTTAYIHQSSRLTNVFQLATVRIQVDETFTDYTTKENVAIENTANTPVYIRAALFITWTDGDGRILQEAPQKDRDYTLAVTQTDWVEGVDGYYYYTKPVPAGQKTSNLLDSLTKTGTGAANKVLTVTIAAQAVQSGPAQAVMDVWGATVDDAGVLTPRGGVAP